MSYPPQGTASQVDVTAIKVQTDKIPSIKTQTDKLPSLLHALPVLWTTPTGTTLYATAGDESLGSLTITGLPSGATVVRAEMVMKVGGTKDDSGSDNFVLVDENIQIQKTIGGSWLTGIVVLTASLYTAPNSMGSGDAFLGDSDVKAQVPANGQSVDFQWAQAQVQGDTLMIFSIQVGLRIWYTL